MAKRSAAEVMDMLEDEIKILRRSCDGMIAANDWDAQLVALSVCKIVYDKGRSQVSLLTQLDPKSDFYFLSSRHYWKDTVDPKTPLASNRTPREDHELPRFQPHDVFTIKDGYYLLSFDAWWEEPVLTDVDGRKFSRKNIVLQLRNKRAAHSDPEREPADFYNAVLGLSSGFECSIDDGPRQRIPGSPLLVTLCHIGEELLATLANRDVWRRGKDAADTLRKAVTASPSPSGQKLGGKPYKGKIHLTLSNSVRAANAGKKLEAIVSPFDGSSSELRFPFK
jgi:hypothetical protein